MIIEDDCVTTLWVYYIGLGIIIIIVPTAVLDYYGYMGVCILYLSRPEQDGQRLRSEVALGLALPCVFLQTLVTVWRPE